MIEYILALAPLFQLHEKPPVLIQGFKERSACMVPMEKMNRTDGALRTPEARAAGLEYVCLQVIRWGV